MNLDALRSDTPGTAHGIHLLAAGSALMARPVITAVKDHLDLEVQIGGYEAHARQRDQLEGVYDSVATLVGGRADEIALVENATVAWCQAFYALPFEPGDRVITCEAEYGANYVAYLQRVRRDGIVVDVAPSTPSGHLDTEALDAMIDDRVKLIATTWIPTNGGLVNPAAEIGRVARAHGVPYLLDACQAAGQMPVDVEELGCDFLSATGRKFLRGPRGTGFLWVRGELISDLEPPMIDHYAADWVATNTYELRPDARRFENWENAYALRAGLGVAVDYALDLGLDTIQERAWGLAARLRAGLSDIDGAQVRDLGDQQCAIVSFTIEGVDPVARVAELRAGGISIGATDPASTRLDAEARDLPMMFRAAPHYYNTEAEVDALLDALT
ncbi:MAG: aminotransferase class V-fold PLP-dependent enzyme [Actinomycetia bacterium]|nr:aminotransferase class V-fold PLP-dependent enzyme [Actinomycetes bacterium]